MAGLNPEKEKKKESAKELVATVSCSRDLRCGGASKRSIHTL